MVRSLHKRPMRLDMKMIFIFMGKDRKMIGMF